MSVSVLHACRSAGLIALFASILLMSPELSAQERRAAGRTPGFVFDLIPCDQLSHLTADPTLHPQLGEDGTLTVTGAGQIQTVQAYANFQCLVVGKTVGVTKASTLVLDIGNRSVPIPADCWSGADGFRISIQAGTDGVQIDCSGQALPYDNVDAVALRRIGLQIHLEADATLRIDQFQMTEVRYRSLFTGRDLTGWEPADEKAVKCWEVRDGLLRCTGEKGGWLRSVSTFDDFHLRLDYRLEPGEAGNSGVYVRVPRDGNHHRDSQEQAPAGFEVQILDDADKRYATLKDYQYCASIYDIQGASPRISRPAGDWNLLEINCTGPNVATIHNGIVVTNIGSETHPLIDLRSLDGFLGLQNHSSQVDFRNIRIGAARSVSAIKLLASEKEADPSDGTN